MQPSSGQPHQNPQYQQQPPPPQGFPGGQQAPGAYGTQPGPYGAQPGPYGAQPGPYGAQPGPYGAQPGPYGAQPGPYGAQPGPYGAQPGPYGAGQPPGPGQPDQIGNPGPSGPSTGQQQPVGVGEIPMEGADGGSEPLVPSAPPITEMQKIQGYDEFLPSNVTFVVPPPSYQEATTGKPIEEVAASAKLTETEARELLIAEAKKKVCWGTGAAKAMNFKNIAQSTAVHYSLKTFLETRSTDWTSEPFKGQMVDGPQNGAAPLPWTIQIPTPPMFQDTTMKCEVPHTASVRVCHGCGGSARVICRQCHGWGRNRCTWCHGSGHTGMGENRRSCSSCNGSGHRRCMNCHGMGRVPCPTCGATGQIKCFIQLTTNFKTNVKDFIIERTPMPDHLIRNVPGTILFEDTQPLLNPIQTFSEPLINENSVKIIQEHRGLAQTGRIWMQNHVIRGVPVFQCDVGWKDKEFQFFVYGDNRLVYVESYPQTCCCGCELL